MALSILRLVLFTILSSIGMSSYGQIILGQLPIKESADHCTPALATVGITSHRDGFREGFYGTEDVQELFGFLFPPDTDYFGGAHIEWDAQAEVLRLKTSPASLLGVRQFEFKIPEFAIWVRRDGIRTFPDHDKILGFSHAHGLRIINEGRRFKDYSHRIQLLGKYQTLTIYFKEGKPTNVTLRSGSYLPTLREPLPRYITIDISQPLRAMSESLHSDQLE